jgi:AbrB family looped-hinge helix DNA binding protein
MNLAKLSANGQITVPVEIRKKLNLKEGDKILFFESPNGEVMINNASASAILNAQKAFAGAAKDFGADSEEDIQRLIDEVRYSEISSQ